MKLSIAGESFVFEAEISETMAVAMVKHALTNQDMDVSGKKVMKDDEGSLRDFVERTEAKRSPDKIVTMGVYWKQKGISSFGRSGLVSGFQELAESVPKNLSRDISWAVRIGWLAPKPKARGEYYVTKKGEEAVEDRFGDQVRAKTRVRKLRDQK